MPIAKLHDIGVYYEHHGSGKPLVLIQGLGLDSSAWFYQIPAFSQHYQVICFDNRGIGRTDVPTTPYSTEIMAADVIELLNVLELDRADVVGFSLGGCIAQALALRYPERVDRLILISTAAKFSARTRQVLQTWARMLEDVSHGAMNPETRLRSQLGWVFTDAFFEDDEQVNALVEQTLQHPYQPNPVGFTGQVTACIHHDLRDRLHQIKAPTLAVVGEADLLTPIGSSQSLAMQIPNAELQVVAAAAHNIFWETPESFNETVLNFLGRTISETVQP